LERLLSCELVGLAVLVIPMLTTLCIKIRRCVKFVEKRVDRLVGFTA